MLNFDWNAFNAACGIGKNELRISGRRSGAHNANEAIQANNSAYSPVAFGNAFLGNNYSCVSNSNNTRIDVNNIKRTGNPDQDAKNFAMKMGITIDEAKNQLRAMFGNPEAPKVNNSTSSQQATDNPFSGNNNTVTNNADNSKIDANSIRKTGNPDQDAKNFAKQMGITIDQAKEQLKAKYGDPTEKSSSSSSSDTTTVKKSDSTTTSTAATTNSTSSSNTTSSSTKETDTSSEFSKNAEGRKKLESTIQYWRAKLKEATDAKDNSGVAYARSQSQKYQTLAKQWDKG